tara:strand:- start:522 stop:677 length:156 start_codon:yes stop_codon:yes gene_type:complete
MTQNKKPKWDGRSRVSTNIYRKRFNEIFKKEEDDKKEEDNLSPDPDNHDYE